MAGLTLHRVGCFPVPLHMNLPACQNGCQYCFVENAPSTPVTIGGIEKDLNIKDAAGLKNYYIKNRFPVCVSNTSDIFNCKNKKLYWECVRILKQAGFPIYLETKGITTEADLEFFNFLDNKDAVYLTVSHFGNDKYEKNAPSFENRIKTLEFLLSKKKKQNGRLNINIGFNPIIPEVFDYGQGLEFVKKYSTDIDGYVIIPCTDTVHRKFAQARSYNQDEIFNNLMPIYKYLKNNDIACLARYEKFPILGLKSLGFSLIDYFNLKNILVSDDIVSALKEAADEAQGKAKNETEKLEIGLTAEDLADIIDMPQLSVKKSEMRCYSYFKLKGLPDIISYRDYFILMGNDYTDYSGIFHFTGMGLDNKNKLWFYPFPELLKNGEKFKTID